MIHSILIPPLITGCLAAVGNWNPINVTGEAHLDYFFVHFIVDPAATVTGARRPRVAHDAVTAHVVKPERALKVFVVGSRWSNGGKQ